MGLNPRGRGRGRGNTAGFYPNQRGGGQKQNFRPVSPGAFSSPVGFHQQTPFGGSPNCNFGSQRPPFGKVPRNNFKKKFPYKSNNNPVIEIDLTRPWVNEEIRNEDVKKQELLQLWKKTKNDEDWDKYKAQKQMVQSLYNKAKAEYVSHHPDQAVITQLPCHQQAVLSTTTSYYCETCDKSFRTDDDLYNHEAEHETCGRDGCEFTAHPKIIAKHIKMQHFSGLYQRIGKLYSQEDIAKWIEERKKRYPTRKVVEEKKILEKEKLSRGEKLKDNDSRFNKEFSNKNKKKFEKKTQKNKNRRTRKKKTTPLVPTCVEEEVCDVRKGVPAFLGINGGKEPEIPEETNLNISDEEWESEVKLQTPAKPILNNSLGLLATFYDSEAENENEEPQEAAKVDVMSADDDSAPEEVPTVTDKNPLPKENPIDIRKNSNKRKLSDRRCNQERKRQNTSYVGGLEKRELTLLEKLLKKEIRHERNVILQCVHFVVKNNFFKT